MDPMTSPEAKSDSFPASPAQRQFWMLHQLNRESPAYNVCSAFRLIGALDRRRLNEGLNAVLRAHDILRVVFIMEEGRLVQRIRPFLGVDIAAEDMGSAEQAEEILKREIEQPFHLEKGPLLRARLLRIGEKDHIFALTMHHSIVDLHSKDIIGKQLSDYYNTGAGPSLPEGTISYGNYALLQERWLRSDECAKMLSYWRNALKGCEGPLSLPSDRPRRPVRVMQGGAHFFELPALLAEKLRMFCRDRSITPFLALLAAYVVFLYRYSRQSVITVGVSLTNRRGDNIKDTVGCFVNMLPVSVEIAGEESFVEALAALRKRMLGAHRHQEIPLEEMVKAAVIPRDPGYNPIYQVGFTFEHPMELTLRGIEAQRLYRHHGGAQLDLLASFWDYGQSIRGYFEYDSALFDAQTVKRWADNFLVTLQSALSRPADPVDNLTIMTPAERDLVVKEWNATDKPYGFDGGLGCLLERQAQKSPDAIALKYRDESLTFAQFHDRAGCLAALLRKLGVGPGKLVGVFMERSIEMAVSLAAIVKSGGAYVPVDPEYPAARNDAAIGDSSPLLILTQDHLSRRAPGHPSLHISVDAEWDRISECNAPQSATPVRADDPAYVIYTSGSTGTPKGAVNTQKGVCNRLLWMLDTYNLSERDAVLQKTPYSFDVSVWEFFLPLISGARLVMAPPGSHRDPSALVRLINDNEITTIHFVPSMLRAFLLEPASRSCRCLKRVFCSGEALPPDLQDRFFSAFDCQLHNLYGPTEAAVDVSYWDCAASKGTGRTPIGRPVANTKLYVLDAGMNPVPVGVAGELFIGGVQVGSGYLNNPELTKKNFTADPFEADPNCRLYKTGDIVRFQNDGALLYIGRVDHQVKIRGNRVELGEIEKALLRHPGVREAAAAAEGTSRGARLLAAFVPSVAGAAPPVSDLRGFLKTLVPDFMIPSAFAAVDSLPLLPNGKIDRKALAKLEFKAADPRSDIMAPKNETQRLIADLWSGELNLPSVSITDNFFDIGGHSLLLVDISLRLQSIFGPRVTAMAMFRYPTVASLSEYIDHGNTQDDIERQASERVTMQRKTLQRAKTRKKAS